MEIWVGTKILVFFRGFNVPTFFLSTKELFNVEEAWLSPNALPTMVPCKVFRIVPTRFFFLQKRPLRCRERNIVQTRYPLWSSVRLSVLYITWQPQPIITRLVVSLLTIIKVVQGPGWLNELGSWFTEQLMQACHQYGMGSRPAL